MYKAAAVLMLHRTVLRKGVMSPPMLRAIGCAASYGSACPARRLANNGQTIASITPSPSPITTQIPMPYLRTTRGMMPPTKENNANDNR